MYNFVRRSVKSWQQQESALSSKMAGCCVVKTKWIAWYLANFYVI